MSYGPPKRGAWMPDPAIRVGKEPRSPNALKIDFGKKVVCTYSSITKHAYALDYALLIPPRHILPGYGKIKVKQFILWLHQMSDISSEAARCLF